MVAIEPVKVVVSDAGPLIHLDELDCLTLLSDFSRVLVPHNVVLEVGRHRSIDFSVPPFEAVSDPVPEAHLQQLFAAFCLHNGEAAALSLAAREENVLFLCDDVAARLVAEEMKIPVHGTIGILLRAVRRDLRSSDEIAEIIGNIPSRSTLHVRADLLDLAIRQLGKSQSGDHTIS